MIRSPMIPQPNSKVVPFPGNFEIEGVETVSFNSPIKGPGIESMEAILKEWGVEYEVKTLYHVKIGHVNFYPNKGTVNLDGARRFKRKGIPFLKEVLLAENIL